MAGTRTVRIGCSGWLYAHWRGRFYPESVPHRRWLEWYAREFDSVELNGTFYRLPEVETVRRWRDSVPRDFVFAWKASRFLTHNKKLSDPREALTRMMSRARPLGSKLGPILYQLPPAWHANPDRLRAFLRALPRRRRHAFEMRNPSWYDAAVLELLERSRAALCLHDMPGSASGRRTCGPFVYVRFHGSGVRAGGPYGARALAPWARWLAEQAEGGREVYAYFNNDVEGHAPRDAALLRDAIARAR
jgi:uncharacterized protein YecE (DUF72 family)